MNLILAFHEQIVEPLQTSLQRIVARINTVWDEEHDEDGGHKTFHNVVECDANGTHLFSAEGDEPNRIRVRQERARAWASYDLLNNTEDESAVFLINNSAATGSDINGEASTAVLYTNNIPLRLGTLHGDPLDLFTQGARKFRLDTSGHFKGQTATGGLGYGTGAGGTVTQATSKATGVTLNKVSGQITMHNAALAAGAYVSFVVTNSAVEVADVPHVCVASGGTANAYQTHITAVGSGSFTVTVQNITGGSLSEAVVIGFVVFKGSVA